MTIALPRIRTRTTSLTGLPYLLLGLIAFVLRAHQLGLFVTPDEANFWMHRSSLFLQALANRDFPATAISTHPGVTTMWLGACGLLVERFLETYGLIEPSFELKLALMRLPVVLTHVAGLLLCYRMLQRLLPAKLATLAALLWAVDPFVIGYSQLLHVDALAGTFATLSLLAALVAWQQEHSRAALVISAVAGGLAILSKSPALLIMPMVTLLALVSVWEAPETAERRYLLRRLVVWGAVLLVTIVALWPALWSDPRLAIERIRSGVMDEGAQPHMLGNFFLGHEDLAPGFAFYPVALALRLTPFTLVGLLALTVTLHRMSPERRRMLAFLAAYAVLFIVMMSIFPKKFNRYLVPIFPAVDVLAAVGLGSIVTLLSRGCDASHRSNVFFLARGVIFLGTLLNAICWQPYSLTAFNQLLGGAQAGAATFQVGWGEGMDQVAAWLNRQPDSTGVVTASTQRDTLQPYLKAGIQAMTPDGEFTPQTGYAVVYVRDAQVHPLAPFDQVYRRMEPIYTVSIHDVPYAWIYQIGPPVAQPRPARFGDSLRLRGFSELSAARRGQTLHLRLFWQTEAVPSHNYALFVHLLGPNGQRYAQLDPTYPTSQWGQNRFVTTEVSLAVPTDLPAGDSTVIIGMYDPLDGKRLPLRFSPPSLPLDDGDNALELLTVHFDPPAQ